ncbi:MAG: hypothetical protein M3042_10230, partial [Actinomycetota bacterium]|nr:hypothetical protein [Actinomycetota bacterium]
METEIGFLILSWLDENDGETKWAQPLADAVMPRIELAVEDARRYAAHLEAEIAQAHAIWREHRSRPTDEWGHCPCLGEGIAAVFG